MKKSFLIRVFWTVVLIATAGAVWAAVNSPLLQVEGVAGAEVYLPLNLSADEAVAGVSGQMVYETALLQDPKIETSAANAAFSVLGKDVSAPSEPGVGRFNFVIYADPTLSIDLSSPAAVFSVRITDDVGNSLSTALTFDGALTSDPAANSLITSFVGFGVVFQTAAKNWAFYE
jgi:hypothetical protein